MMRFLLLFLGAIAVMAFGIGWGRSGFGPNANMGLAGRYGWIMWPGLAGIYFLWLLYGGEVLSKRVPMALCLAVMVMLPFNIGTGIVEGERYREFTQQWDEAVREGVSDEELIDLFHPKDYPHVQQRIRVALRLLRAGAIGYYFPLREPTPAVPRVRRSPKRRVRTLSTEVVR